MSRVAQVILVVDPDDDGHVEDIAFWMAADGPRADDRTSSRVGALMPLTGAVGEDLWGGFKSITVSVWGAVTNHLDWDGFLERTASMPWAAPDRVQLLMKSESDPYFRIYMFWDGRLVNIAPPPNGDKHWPYPD